MATKTYYAINPTDYTYAGPVDVDDTPSLSTKTPPYTTPDAPPSNLPDKTVAVFRAGDWVPTQDHRGETWWAGHGQPVTITWLGDPHADGLLPTEPPAPPSPVPAVISRRQFYQQLAVAETITEAEALDAVKKGDVPAVLAGFLATLPQDQRFAAEMLLSGATGFERAHPLVTAVGAAQGLTDAQIDQFFRDAAALA